MRKETTNKQNVTSNQQKLTSSKQKVTSNEQNVMNNEKKVTGNEQKLTSNEQKVSSNKEKVTSNEKKVTSNQQKLMSNEHQAKSFTSLKPLPTVDKMRQTFMTDEMFPFKIVTEDIVRKETVNLDGSKTTPDGDISVNILKSTVDIHLPSVTNIIKFSINEAHFPEELKLAEVSPIFKKKDDLNKENYRPISVLLHVPKVSERVMYH